MYNVLIKKIKRKGGKMITNKTVNISRDKLKTEIDDMTKKYNLNSQEKKELEFIINAFYKFYKKMNDSDTEFSEKDILDVFDSTVLDSIVGTYNNTGLQTRANIFYKNLPSICSLSSQKKESSTTKKKSSDNYSSHSYREPSHNYGSCGSSYNSRSYDYGGCGGSGRYGSSYSHC